MPTAHLIAVATLVVISLPAVIAIPSRWTTIAMTSIGGLICTVTGDIQLTAAVVGVQILTIIAGEVAIRVRRRKRP